MQESIAVWLTASLHLVSSLRYISFLPGSLSFVRFGERCFFPSNLQATQCVTHLRVGVEFESKQRAGIHPFIHSSIHPSIRLRHPLRRYRAARSPAHGAPLPGVAPSDRLRSGGPALSSAKRRPAAPPGGPWPGGKPPAEGDAELRAARGPHLVLGVLKEQVCMQKPTRPHFSRCAFISIPFHSSQNML